MAGLGIALGILAVLGAIGFALSLLKKADSVSPRSAGEKVFGDDVVGRQVRAVVVAMWSGTDGEADRLVDALRADQGASIAEIGRVYKALPAEDHDLRWALVNLATIVGGVATLPLLEAVITTPVPTEISGEKHRFPTVTRELMIRIRALEGIRTLAAAGHDTARRFLVDQLKSPHFSIRKSAALALLGLRDGAQYKDLVMEHLPRDEHFVLDIREARVEEAGVIRYPTGATSPPAKQASPAPRLAGAPETPKKRALRKKGPPTI